MVTMVLHSSSWKHLLLLWVVLGLVADVTVGAQDPPYPDFDMNNMMGGQDCPKYRCSKGYTPVPKSRMKFESTGCSSMGGGAVMMNPGAPGAKKPFESCCDQWHACYKVCGVSKKKCDENFDACAKQSCGADEDCSKDANLSSLMMKVGGCKTFDQAQYAACDCKPKEGNSAKTAREAAIRYFYKKFAPDNIDKVANLAAKADTPEKLAGLFVTLLKKYPKAIQIVEDPMKKMFEKINVERDEKADDEKKQDDQEEVEDEEEINDEDKIEL